MKRGNIEKGEGWLKSTEIMKSVCWCRVWRKCPDTGVSGLEPTEPPPLDQCRENKMTSFSDTREHLTRTHVVTWTTDWTGRIMWVLFTEGVKADSTCGGRPRGPPWDLLRLSGGMSKFLMEWYVNKWDINNPSAIAIQRGHSDPQL